MLARLTAKEIAPQALLGRWGLQSTAVAFPNQLYGLVNQARKDAGLSPLKLHERLAKAAKAHACDMAQRNFISHQGPEGRGPSWRALQAGYDPLWLIIGENIAAGFPSPGSVFHAWMSSPGHRGLILHPQFTEMGLGYCYDEQDEGNVVIFDGNVGGPYYHYWCLLFGNRRMHKSFLPRIGR